MARTFTHIVKRLLLLLVAGTTSVFIAACYGTQTALRVWTIKARDPLSNPIPALRVTVRNNLQPSAPDTLDVLYTDRAGVARFTYGDDYGPLAGRDSTFLVDVDDVDSTLNGGPYRSVTLPLPADESDTVFVTLEP